MNFRNGYPLSFTYQHQEIPFTVQGEPNGELCITCAHTLFIQRFNGGTMCFHPFTSAPFLPDETDEHYEYFRLMKMTILKAYAELNPNK